MLFQITWTNAAISLGIIVVSVIIADVLLVLFEKLFRKLTTRTKTTLDDFLFEHLRSPFRAFLLVFGVYAALSFSFPEFSFLERELQDWLFLVLILVAGYAGGAVVDGFFKWYSSESDETNLKRKVSISKNIFPLARKLSKIGVYSVAVLIVLSELGVEIGPLLAGLGIAGLAVALALQSVLANFFAGLYILSDKPIRVGDRISLDSEAGLTGNVEQIGWRSTRILSPGNVTYVIPNDKIANSVIVNYDLLPGGGRSVVIPVGVSYDSEVAKVEKALREADEDLKKKNPAVVKEFEPIIRFNGFGDSALNYLYIFQTKTYADRFQAINEAHGLVLEKFRKHGIDIPFPIRTVYMRGEKTKKR